MGANLIGMVMYYGGKVHKILVSFSAIDLFKVLSRYPKEYGSSNRQLYLSKQARYLYMNSNTETPVLPSIRPKYRPLQPGLLRKLFLQHFPTFEALYEERYASFCGKFRLPHIENPDAEVVCGSADHFEAIGVPVPSQSEHLFGAAHPVPPARREELTSRVRNRCP
jgi:hypothetical protein